MSTMQELEDAVTAAKGARDAARNEYAQARADVDQALAAVNSAVNDRVRAQDSTVAIPIGKLKTALDALTGIEQKYAVPPDATP